MLGFFLVGVGTYDDPQNTKRYFSLYCTFA